MIVKTKDKCATWLFPNSEYSLREFHSSDKNRDGNGYLCFPILLEGVSFQIDHCDLINFDEESVHKLTKIKPIISKV